MGERSQSFDQNGEPFIFPTCILSRREYAKIVSEINTNYELYRGKGFCVHYTVGADDRYYMYYFENHGYDDYNIFEKFSL